jgi:TrmH family RNA methyltransferase
MISKNKSGFIHSLSHKKFRDEHQCFVAEGTRLIRDLHGSFNCRMIVATTTWAGQNPLPEANEQLVTDEKDFQKISGQKQPQGILAVYETRKTVFESSILHNELVLALDNVQDPGNLGTLLRIADWFGINHVLCTPGTADVYNPKTVQATMGALARVNVHYMDLAPLLGAHDHLPVYGTFLEGNSIYDAKLSTNGIIILGNEGNGISPEIEKLVTSKLLIPSYPSGQPTSESLNVGMAAAVICSEFRRRM